MFYFSTYRLILFNTILDPSIAYTSFQMPSAKMTQAAAVKATDKKLIAFQYLMQIFHQHEQISYTKHILLVL